MPVWCAGLDESLRTEINIHEKKLRVKLVIYKDYTEMHGQQNIQNKGRLSSRQFVVLQQQLNKYTLHVHQTQPHTVGCATTNDATTNECNNGEYLSIKLGCYNEHRRYKEREVILFIMESSIIVFTKERLFMLFMCVRLFMIFIRESLFIVFTKETLFMLFMCVRLFMLFIREVCS